MAKNRLATVTVDATGRLTELKFHTDGYRGMAPAELSSTLVEAIGRAQRQMSDRVAKVYESVAPDGVDAAAAMRGEVDVEQTLRSMGVSLDDFR